MAEQLNDFGKKLFLQIVKEDKNVVVSPLSIFTALGMLSLGANGKTKEEILKTLHFSSDSDVEPLLEKLLKSLKSASDTKTLSLANNSFISPACILKEKFVSDIKRLYNSEVTTKKFFFTSKEESAKEINTWVEEKTQNAIKNLITPNFLDKDTMFVLVSAIYFKADWQRVFESEKTKQAPFHIATGNTVQVQMMYKREKMSQYGENEIAKWVRLPYRGQEFNGVFVLPKNKGKLVEEVAPFLFSTEKQIELPSQERKLDTLAIPKFKFEYGADLKDLLAILGIQSAFSPKDSDLSGISENEELFVSRVIHKAMVEVDEQGTVAAAATAISGSRKRKKTEKEEPLNFIADQPFFFLLEHVPSKSVVFTAKIYNPAQN